MSDMTTDTAHDDRVAAQPEGHIEARRINGFGIGVCIVLFGILLLLVDYSDMFLSDSRRRAALDIIKPGMRLTQAERALNSAGYLTLYIENASLLAPMLQVSSLSRVPLTADFLHTIAPNSPPDKWLRAKLTEHTRFYIMADTDGTVDFSADGDVKVFPGPVMDL